MCILMTPRFTLFADNSDFRPICYLLSTSHSWPRFAVRAPESQTGHGTHGACAGNTTTNARRCAPTFGVSFVGRDIVALGAWRRKPRSRATVAESLRIFQALQAIKMHYIRTSEWDDLQCRSGSGSRGPCHLCSTTETGAQDLTWLVFS